LRTVFIGTSEFAAGVLEQLAGSAHRPALVVTRPDRPRGRGRRLGAPPVAERARALEVPLAQPERVNEPDAVAQIDAADPESVIVCAFGALIKEPLLSRQPLLNVHPSLLPRWRGAAPVERAIVAGDPQTGVSIMRLTEGLDSGPVCLAGSEAIQPDDDYGSLSERLCRLGGELLLQVLDRTEAGAPLPFVEQDDAMASYAEKIGPDDRLLDPSRTAQELERVVRALHPHIGARLQCPDGSMLGVGKARVAGDLDASPRSGSLARDGERLLFGVDGGALELLEVHPAGGRPMSAQAYLRGHAL
jgi:methionyl-tRNA formyltransferase